MIPGRGLDWMSWRWFADLKHYRETGALAVSLAVPDGVPHQSKRNSIAEIAGLMGLTLIAPRGAGQPYEMVGRIGADDVDPATADSVGA